MNRQHINRYLQEFDKPSTLISWSKNGFIVYVSPTIESEDNLYLTYLENIDGKSWKLAKPQPINVKLENNFSSEISLVCWSSLSTDLAVSDVFGNFYILLSGVRLLDSKNDSSPNYELTSYNHMEMIYRDIINQDIKSTINLGASIVAFKWLNIEKHQLLNKPAKLENNEFIYGVGQYPPYGITHPISTKQACVALRRNGQFMLYYQGEHKVEYHKTLINLTEQVLYIQKASIGFNNKDIIVTIWDSLSNRIVTYSIAIEWGFLVESAKKQKVDPHFHTPKELQKPPKLSISKIHEMMPEGEVSSIDIISTNAEKSPLNILVSYESTIYRYQIIPSINLISDAFIDLGVKKNIELEEKQIFTLQLQDKLVRDGQVQSIISGPSDLHIMIIYKHGRIDVIDVSTWKIVGESSQTISTLFEAGYVFPELESNLILTVSPNMSAVVYTKIYNMDNELKIQPLIKNSDNLYKISVAFAYRHAYSCYTNTCSDDLLLLIEPEDKFITQIIKECHKSLNFQSDSFNKESADKLLSNPPLQKLLSLQYTLGELQNNSMRDLAWIVLNLRSTSFAIMFTLSSIYRQLSKKKSEDRLQDAVIRGECILSLIGNVQWLIDLIAYITQELLSLTFRTKHSKPIEKALPLLINKIPRLFLMYAVPSIQKFYEIIKKFCKDVNLLKPMKETLNRFFLIYDPILFQNFQSFLLFIDALITKEYNGKENLIINPISDSNIGNLILERFSIIISKESKRSDLYFHDTRLIQEMNSSIDGLRKIVLNDAKTRRCTRCRANSLIKDPLVFDQNVPLWTMVFQRNCICGNSWVNI
ncbi:unnamed protein product [Candida verbasci]|uniref:Mediator of RNA polymerase II transcription subunit 16 n=1 Tax=Candida verbasci TaxID=1227364 RepID=A0A9W4XFG9_9ASCO|nr:unnamed protein product [Candida verbasci]